MDLVVPPGPGLPDGLVIPDGELVERFSRSPGPGGQSVNTTDTRVELLWDPAASAVLDERQRSRLLARTDGPIGVVAHEHRSQLRNRSAARERLAARVRELLAPPPPPRRATKPTRGSKERRLQAKRQRGETKRLRGRPQD
ncbi:MAG TPA: alternative ribosome rescue aminoacyl-tRNA hydrolase ArfB [Nocardioides sp.]|nr:alternative ribosome rescue aminoacyl-tRNA hydrolase ArfB [Nocardioides sp.]